MKGVVILQTFKEKWTGVLIGKMHNEGVTSSELAKELGIGKAYVSMILNGQRHPADAEKTFNDALNKILKERHKGNEDSKY